MSEQHREMIALQVDLGARRKALGREINRLEGELSFKRTPRVLWDYQRATSQLRAVKRDIALLSRAIQGEGDDLGEAIRSSMILS